MASAFSNAEFVSCASVYMGASHIAAGRPRVPLIRCRGNNWSLATGKTRLGGTGGLPKATSVAPTRVRIPRSCQHFGRRAMPHAPAARHIRRPRICGCRRALSYGPNIDAIYRQLARFAIKLLNGTAVGEIPPEEPTKFELVINRCTADAIGIRLSLDFLISADQVIEQLGACRNDIFRSIRPANHFA